MIRRSHALVLFLACVLPRAIALVAERRDVLSSYIEKSDAFARLFVSSGTFGQIPGIPSAYTQPLYAFFLIPIYWIDRSWWLVGGVQIVVAFLTALVVYAIGMRIGDARVALAAALISTLHPYLIWHDIHVNREILDQLAGALLVLATLACAERPTLRRGAVLGLITGVAVLGNSRLVLLPFVLGAYLIVLRRREAVIPAAAILAGVAVAVVPWVARNETQIGCATITTDSRALWKANNPATLETLRRGDWIDQVPNIRGAPPTPQDAADRYAQTGQIIKVDECAQMRYYQHRTIEFWRDEPGEKARLAGLAVWGFWSPEVGPAGERSSGSGTPSRSVGSWVVPAWFLALLAFAVAGARMVPRRFLWLALTLFAYETVMAMVFTGATRYRVAWEFLLALLAAPAVVALVDRIRRRAE
jgi:hypothetical protein